MPPAQQTTLFIPFHAVHARLYVLPMSFWHALSWQCFFASKSLHWPLQLVQAHGFDRVTGFGATSNATSAHALLEDELRCSCDPPALHPL